MSEFYDPQEISRMCRRVLKTSDDMNESLKKAMNSLNVYRKHLDDNIIRKECNERIDSAEEAAKLINKIESGGLEG